MMHTAEQELLRVENLTIRFPLGRDRVVHAVEDVSFTVAPGETLALVGESGSGKSTIGLAVMRWHDPVSGRIHFGGADVTETSGKHLRALRRDLQMIFQDPYSSLNRHMKVGELVAEPLRVHGLVKDDAALRTRVGELLEMCGLPASVMDLAPTAFSGGERQRIAIARALSLGPRLIVADEAVSALDVSIQAQIINLMLDLQEQGRVSFLFISHNLAAVRQLASRVMVLYAGKVMETGDVHAIFEGPAHPYTQALLSAAPVADYRYERSRSRIILEGEVPSPIRPPPGCRFSPRCPLAVDQCFREAPPLDQVAPGRWSACWRAEDVATLRKETST
jgi:oligopeptide/dipeptide ABC transporter ATP-binding protein